MMIFNSFKTRHIFKNQVIVLPKGDDIIDITVGKREPESDIILFRVQRNNFSEKQLFAGDEAYIGEENILTPHKKPKNGECSNPHSFVKCGRRADRLKSSCARAPNFRTGLLVEWSCEWIAQYLDRILRTQLA